MYPWALYDISQNDANEIQTFLCPNSKVVASSKRPPLLEAEEKKKRPSSVKRGFSLKNVALLSEAFVTCSKAADLDTTPKRSKLIWFSSFWNVFDIHVANTIPSTLCTNVLFIYVILYSFRVQPCSLWNQLFQGVQFWSWKAMPIQ